MRQERLGAPVLCAALAVAGLWATMWLWNIMQPGWASEKWPVAEGYILESKMTRNVAATPDTNRRRRSWETPDEARKRQATRVGPDVKYDVLIRYQYEVNGRTYESSRITFAGLGMGFMEEPAALELMGRLGNKETVEVHYNPSNPSEATLETGVAWWIYLITGVAAGATFLFAWAAWVGFRHAAE